MTEQFGLKQKAIEEVKELLKKNVHVKKAIIYGSRAMGNYKVGSDIDLTLIGDDLTSDDVSHIQHELSESYLPYLFDISILRDINNSSLVDHIQRVGKVFYKRG